MVVEIAPTASNAVLQHGCELLRLLGRQRRAQDRAAQTAKLPPDYFGIVYVDPSEEGRITRPNFVADFSDKTVREPKMVLPPRCVRRSVQNSGGDADRASPPARRRLWQRCQRPRRRCRARPSARRTTSPIIRPAQPPCPAWRQGFVRIEGCRGDRDARSPRRQAPWPNYRSSAKAPWTPRSLDAGFES